MKQRQLLKQATDAQNLSRGKMLCCQGEDEADKELYVVGGVSYDEVALVRLFEENNMDEVLVKKCYRLSSKLLLPSWLKDIEVPLYADVSRLVSKGIPALLGAVTQKKNNLFGRVSRKDMDCIITLISTAKTIPQSQKTKYLELI
jgi:hypothetical protein